MVFWHPNGWTIYRILEDYIRARQKEAAYQEINTPQIVDRKLWEDLVIGISIEKICLLQKLMRSMQMKKESML